MRGRRPRRTRRAKHELVALLAAGGVQRAAVVAVAAAPRHTPRNVHEIRLARRRAARRARLGTRRVQHPVRREPVSAHARVRVAAASAALAAAAVSRTQCKAGNLAHVAEHAAPHARLHRPGAGPLC